jgi:hypothetical protein
VNIAGSSMRLDNRLVARTQFQRREQASNCGKILGENCGLTLLHKERKIYLGASRKAARHTCELASPGRAIPYLCRCKKQNHHGKERVYDERWGLECGESGDAHLQAKSN